MDRGEGVAEAPVGGLDVADTAQSVLHAAAVAPEVGVTPGDDRSVG